MNPAKEAIEELVRHYGLSPLPVEGTLVRGTYQSAQKDSEGRSTVSTMMGLYCESPQSLSCFHRLDYDEVWHFYEGDPLELHLLYPDGSTQTVVMGRDRQKGQLCQFVIPAHVWQGGCIVPGGAYALFGCTVAPAFTPSCFEAGLCDELIKAYPDKEAVIRKLSVNGDVRRMPD